MKYEIDITDCINDYFENEADNVMTAIVYSNQEQKNENVKYVMLYMSKNAMLGMGTESIRLAHNFKEGRHMHLEPSSKERQVQTMGVFLKPESVPLIICCDEGKPIDDYLNVDV